MIQKRWILILSVIVFAMIMGMWAMFPFLLQFLLRLQELFGMVLGTQITRYGSFGDLFGALNCLFTGLAFASVVVTLLLQQKQISEQKEELQLQQRQIEKQAKIQTLLARLQAKDAIVQTHLALFQRWGGVMGYKVDNKSSAEMDKGLVELTKLRGEILEIEVDLKAID